MNEHFSALSLLLCLNYPGDIVITINNSAMIIIFNALWKSLEQKSQRGIPLTLSIEGVDREFWKCDGEGSRWEYITDEHRNATTLSAMERWKKRRYKRTIKELRMSATGRSYTQIFFKVQYIIIQAILGWKSMKNFAVTDEIYIYIYRYIDIYGLLTVKDNDFCTGYR